MAQLVGDRRIVLQRQVVAALLVFAWVAIGPMTPMTWIPSLLGGALACAAWVFGRRVAERRGWWPPPPPGYALQRPPALVAAGLVVLVFAFGPTLVWLFRRWTLGVWHNFHGLLVPIVIAYLSAAILRRDASGREESSPLGFAFVGAGLALLVVDSGAGTGYVATLGLILAIPGVSLLLLGERRTRLLALPLGLSAFLMPLPIEWSEPLQMMRTTSAGTMWILNAIGIPAYVHETRLVLPTFSFAFTYACSGFPVAYAGLFAAVILAAHTPSTPRRVLLFASIWPLTMLFNVLRSAALLGAAHFWGEGILHSSLHAGSGAFAFVCVIGALGLIGDWRAVAKAFR